MLPTLLVALCTSLVVAFPAVARAEIPMDVLLRHLARGPGPATSRLRRPLSAVVRATGGLDADAAGLLRISPTVGVVRGDAEHLRQLAAAHPGWTMTWGAPRRLLLDEAAPLIGAVEVRRDTGLTGRGVAVGIVDSGLDLGHPDFRDAEGATRVAWLVDLTAEPLGLHPEAEDRCAAAGLRCAVYSGQDLDQRAAAGQGVPGDSFGHGTHVASLAAGNGRADEPARYVGVAPEATLLIARATQVGLAVDDVDVLVAVEVLFWLAEQYGPSRGAPRLPTVVNLSLGSDFGAHDGSSPLGEGLAALVAEEYPGRALVVAAGNSATLYEGFESFPEPLGVHTNVHVLDEARIPIVSPVAGAATRVSADLLLWLEMAPGDALSVGLERRDGSVLVAPVPPGGSELSEHGDFEVLVVNRDRERAPFLPATRPGAIVVVSGRWPSDETFGLRLRGTGTVDVWVQSEGDLSPGRTGFGSLVPAAVKDGTINTPASHPELISVGATQNRVGWTDRDGQRVDVSVAGASARPDSTVYFSSAGPNAAGVLKPDLVAPGAWLIGALSSEADPFENAFSIFHAGGSCRPLPGCALVGDRYGVSSGTSMAAPLVAGAIALLLERDPSLTQRQARRLLQASARPLTGDIGSPLQVGAGALDVGAALELQQGASDRAPSARSRIVLASAFAVPDPSRPVRGIVQLRDANGAVADGFIEADLSVATNAAGTGATIARVSPGLLELSGAARSGSGGGRLEFMLTYDGAVIARAELPVAVDASAARHGMTASGGCALARESSGGGAALVGLTIIAWRGRRSRRGARGVGSPGRRGMSG